VGLGADIGQISLRSVATPSLVQWHQCLVPSTVMPGLDPGIHRAAAWIAGPGPAMTTRVEATARATALASMIGQSRASAVSISMAIFVKNCVVWRHIRQSSRRIPRNGEIQEK